MTRTFMGPSLSMVLSSVAGLASIMQRRSLTSTVPGDRNAPGRPTGEKIQLSRQAKMAGSGSSLCAARGLVKRRGLRIRDHDDQICLSRDAIRIGEYS